MRTFQPCYFQVALLAGSLATTFSAFAAEPRSAAEPRLMQEPGEVTNIIDAFEEGDPFDLHIQLGFEYSSKTAKILRETTIHQAGLTTGGYTSNLMNVANYTETTSKLVPRFDVGLYHDVSLHLALPIILNNARELTDLDGSQGNEDIVLAGAPGETLFTLPFSSPNRSGLEHIAVGIDAGIFNQITQPRFPTWTLGLEGRFSVGEPMHACNPIPKEGQVVCANPADINRNGVSDSEFEGVDASERDAGITRGTIGLEAHTFLSRRIRNIEPYVGFSGLIEFQQDSSDYGLTDLNGTLVNHPPLVGSMILGLMITPWENKEKFSRVQLDLRLTGQYHSEGRDYSELFDALGSSDAASLRNPQYASYKTNPDYDPTGCEDGDSTTLCPPKSVIDQSSEKGYHTGLSDVQAYGSFKGSASVTWQASEYIKFQFGMGYEHTQSHGITAEQPCNPDFKNDLGKSGPCHTGEESTGELSATGVPNPNYRPTINSVGRRFYVDESNTFHVFASGTIMF